MSGFTSKGQAKFSFIESEILEDIGSELQSTSKVQPSWFELVHDWTNTSQCDVFYI